MAKSDQDQHFECMNRFIELGNSMKDEGIATNVISGGMMYAADGRWFAHRSDRQSDHLAAVRVLDGPPG